APRTATSWANGKVCSSWKNCGHTTIAVAIANRTVNRIPSSRNIDSSLNAHTVNRLLRAGSRHGPPRYARRMTGDTGQRGTSRRFSGPSDLHLHSNHSDGTESPSRVVKQANAQGNRTHSLTDHDRTTERNEARAAAASLGVTFLPGMELSAKHAWRSVHVL